MLKSMTGFAKVEIEGPEGRLYGEARSLNSRYLEISIKVSRMDFSYEQKLRELAKRIVKRGKVDILFKWERSQGQPAPFKINETIVKRYIDMAEALKREYRINGKLTLDTIFGLRDIITYEDANNIPEDTLFHTLDGLLEKLNEEKSKEGAVILKDFMLRLRNISALLDEVETQWPANVTSHEEKLREKIMEATKAASIDETRILQELAIYMDRLDISEEIVRLKGHLENFRDTVESEDAIGRKLDFIIQEMVREANTMGSKSNDLYINERVIKIKVEIEKMREQTQNVE
ncbi:MAG: YicC family protein [Syntrophobacterales bacterium]|nr:YicC family protein [Syntrophobacterales bacterium]